MLHTQNAQKMHGESGFMCMEWGKYTHGSGMWGGHGGEKWVEMGGKG